MGKGAPGGWPPPQGKDQTYPQPGTNKDRAPSSPSSSVDRTVEVNNNSGGRTVEIGLGKAGSPSSSIPEHRQQYIIYKTNVLRR
eukprot:13249809-Heterocapsa_arctica.AAC.1